MYARTYERSNPRTRGEKMQKEDFKVTIPISNQGDFKINIQQNENPSIFICGDLGKWMIKMNEKGIEFNRAEYPQLDEDGFAKSFCDVLEKCYAIKFIKKTLK